MPAAGASRSCRSCTSVAQLRARWGRDGARTILDACGTKVFLPGSSDPETLEMASRLSGQVAARERGAGHDTRHPVMTEDMIRQLPARRDGTGYAFVLRNGLSPVIGRPPVIWRDRTARRLARRAQQATQPTVLPEAIPARCTPGAESAAAAWSDEAAEDALLAAAGRNGYVAGHSAAAARSAIRSGLRNGLRSPRPLPDFTSRPALHAPERGRAPEQMGPGAGEQARARPPAAARKSPAASDRRGSVSSARPAGTSSRDGPTGTPSEIGDSVAATLRAAGFKPSGQGHGSPDEPEGFVLQRSPDGRIVIQHTAIAQPAGGVPPWDRAGQMLDRYARNLRGAGYDITRSDPASLTVRGPSPSPHARMGTEIDAKRVLHQATAARAEGDQARAHELIRDAARLDPRMTSLWDQDLSGLPGRRPEPAVPDQAGLDDTPGRPAVEPAGARDCGKPAAPRWPEKPVLHRSHDAHGRGTRPQVAESGTTVAAPGVAELPADRQPRPDPQTQHDRVQEAAVRTAPPDWRDAVTERERSEWQPKVVAAQPDLAAAAEPSGAEING